ncbi:MAG: hypothetical protein ACI3XQ_04525 [Eubacteriales bacterium]
MKKCLTLFLVFTMIIAIVSCNKNADDPANNGDTAVGSSTESVSERTTESGTEEIRKPTDPLGGSNTESGSDDREDPGEENGNNVKLTVEPSGYGEDIDYGNESWN